MASTLRSALLATLMVIASACIPVGPKNTTSASWRQDTPKIASDGTNVLAVWRDYRDGNGNGQIYGAIIGPDQSILVADIAISVQAGTESSPNVVFDGTNYVVAWGDRRGGDADLYATRVATDGQVLDVDGVLIAGGQYDQRRPALAFDGTNLLIVYEETSNLPTAAISARRVSPDLTVIDSNPIVLSTANKDALFPDVVFDGTSFVAGWTETILDNSDVMVRQIDAAGVAGPPIPITDDNDQHFDVTMTFDGINTMVVYSSAFNPVFPAFIHGKRVSTAGTLVDTAPIFFEYDPDESTYLPRTPDVAWDGSSYVLAYTIIFEEYDTRSYVVRVDATGARTSELRRLAASNEVILDKLDQPAVAMVDDSAVIAMSGRSYEVDEARAVFATTLLPDDDLITGVPLAAVSATQRPRAIAYGNGVHLVVWSDYTGTRAARFDTQLQPLDSVPIELDVNGSDLDAVFNGTNFILGNSGRLIAISPSGALVNTTDLPPLGSPFGVRGHALISAGSNTLLVRYLTDRIETTLIDVSGTPAAPGSIAVNGLSIDDASGAWDGSVFHIAWSDRRNGNRDIYGTRVDASGSPLDPVGTPIEFGPGEQTDPKLAASNGSVLAVWTDRESSSAYGVDGVYVGSSGVPTGSVLQFANGVSERPITDVETGLDFSVVWRSPSGSSYDIDAARVVGSTVTPLGTVVSTQEVDDPFLLLGEPSLELEATVPGVTALLYRDVDPDDGAVGSFWRIFYS